MGEGVSDPDLCQALVVPKVSQGFHRNGRPRQVVRVRRPPMPALPASAHLACSIDGLSIYVVLPPRQRRGTSIDDGPGRDRTCDLGIKSPLLYQLSYRPAPVLDRFSPGFGPRRTLGMRASRKPPERHVRQKRRAHRAVGRG
jgi:hypothetical protein